MLVLKTLFLEPILWHTNGIQRTILMMTHCYSSPGRFQIATMAAVWIRIR